MKPKAKPLPNCLDCGNQLKRHHNKRCRSCFGKRISKLLSGENHYRYKDGRKKPCLTCGKIIKAYYPRNCRDCYTKSLIGKVKPGLQNTGRTRFKKGVVVWNKGIEWVEMRGEKNPAYIDGRTSLVQRIRGLSVSDEWRINVFKRDGFKCRQCGLNKPNFINADHIRPFKFILNDFLNKHKNLSAVNDKEELIRLSLEHKEFWDINNGQTLCLDCHKMKTSMQRKEGICEFS